MAQGTQGILQASSICPHVCWGRAGHTGGTVTSIQALCVQGCPRIPMPLDVPHVPELAISHSPVQSTIMAQLTGHAVMCATQQASFGAYEVKPKTTTHVGGGLVVCTPMVPMALPGEEG